MESAVAESPKEVVQKTVFSILFAISAGHFLNDMLQSIIQSIFPLLKQNFHLTYTQIGLITFTFQITASLLQPVVGSFTDRKPRPYSLPVGMTLTLIGVLMLAQANSFIALLVAVAIMGTGSSIFHPESSRLARLASGGQKGLAQSIFQLGGNAGSAVGPLLVALIVVANGQRYISWFAIAALIAIIILFNVSKWYKAHLNSKVKKAVTTDEAHPHLSKKKVASSLVVLLLLIFSKFFYLSSMTSYYTFFLIGKFHVSIKQSQMYLFIYLAAVAAGTLIGGYLGDRFGRKYVIWFSILGAAPFTLALPYVSLPWVIFLSVIIGLVISSAFSAIVVYGQELVPGKVGTVSGLFFGLAFGMGGLGSALLGNLADHTSIYFVFKVCAFLPLIGIVTGFLPDLEGKKWMKKAVQPAK